MTPDAPRRRMPEIPFPPYTYVPGRAPHPFSDPAGHAYGRHPSPPPPLDDTNWPTSTTYLYAVDLFNHGYYWEAHEAWESLWHACGHRGAAADLLKGLIKLAAAGVKAREGLGGGTATHARRAAELIRAARTTAGPRLFGLALDDLAARAERAATTAIDTPSDSVPRRVFEWTLTPGDE